VLRDFVISRRRETRLRRIAYADAVQRHEALTMMPPEAIEALPRAPGMVGDGFMTTQGGV